MIYSNFLDIHHYLWNKIEPLRNCKFNDDDIFYHHHYHQLFNKIKLQDCIDEKHWHHIVLNPNVKLVHENCGETFTVDFADDIKEVIRRGVRPNQIYIMVMDELHREFLKNCLNVPEVNIGVHNHLQKNVQFPELNDNPTHKFSSLSRNYKPWRLKLYSRLVQNNAIENFNYSFYNIHAYDKTEFTPEQMIKDLDVDTPAIREWVGQCPHVLDGPDNVGNKWNNITYDTILDSKVHLIVETHFDVNYYTKQEFREERQCPSFITEKVYKAIVCQKPFLIFATPFFLEDLRSMGYKTFNPYIDETYDTIKDNTERLNALTAEIDRINKLAPEQLDDLINMTKVNTIANYNMLKIVKTQTKVNSAFDFVGEHNARDDFVDTAIF